MPKRGIATAQTPEHIEKTLAAKVPSYENFLKKNWTNQLILQNKKTEQLTFH